MRRSESDNPKRGARSLKSFCRICGAACPLEVDVSGNRVVAVRADRDDPIYGGFTCVKGRRLGDFIHHPDRLATSLRRGLEGAFEALPTTRALDEIADRLRTIIERDGPRAVASYCGTAAQLSAVAMPVARAFHAAIGSPSFYTSLTIDQPGKLVLPARHGGWAAGSQPFTTADVSLMVGLNLPVSMMALKGMPGSVNPLVKMREAKARGWKLIAIDPRRTELSQLADIHLQCMPGEDPTLLAGFLKVIIGERLHDAEFCRRWVRNLDELEREVALFDLDQVAARAGVSRNDIVKAARMFAAGPRGSAACGTGPNMAPHGALAEHLVACLNTVCGRYPRAGEWIDNPGGVFGFGRPWVAPRAQAVAPMRAALTSGEPHRVRGLRAIFGEGMTSVLPEEILLPGPGRIRALLTVGGNPVVAFPDQVRTVEALRDLELHVVLDPQMTPTAKLAHYVVPAEMSLERPDIPVIADNFYEDPYVQYTPAVIDAPPEVVGEARLYIELADRLGVELRLSGGIASTATSPDELLELCFPSTRIAWNELRRSPGGSLRPELAHVVAPSDEAANGYLDVGPDDVLTELSSVRLSDHPLGALRGFEPDVHRFRLVSRRLKSMMNSSGREIDALRVREGTNFAFMNPADLDELGIADGDAVEVASPSAAVCTFARAADDVRRGVVSMSHCWGDAPGSDDGGVADWDRGASTSRLVDGGSMYDPLTGLPILSALPVSVRPMVLVDDAWRRS
ncbi:MAG TPA: molybdopterin-dependent oxidoreductase [Ilumatobacter sp.]|nr:molybdopterin-dependent oxidoreductase [Ilumatobacter sp.]